METPFISQPYTRPLPLSRIRMSPRPSPLRSNGFAATGGGRPAAVGVTLMLADAAPTPAAFIATTEQSYEVPFVRLVTTMGEAAAPAECVPGMQVAVYCVMGAPPFEAGAEKAMVAWPLPGVADRFVG